MLGGHHPRAPWCGGSPPSPGALGVTPNSRGEPDSRFGLVLEVPAEGGVEVVPA